MKALLCSEFGPAEKLSIGEVDDPVPAKGEVVIDIRAAALNFPDTLMIEGKYQFQPPFPFSPGSEVAGVVSALGDGVEGVSIGDRVIANTLQGAFAEKISVPAVQILAMSEAMDFHRAAGLSVTYGTSYHALKQRAEIREGETLLVLGAAGGVGLAAVELGKAMGARVIAAASSDEKLETAKAAGADELINYSTEDLKARAKELAKGQGHGMGVDVIYDPVGGELANMALRTLAPSGRYLVIGFASGEIPKIPLNLVLLKQCQIVGVFWGAWTKLKPHEHTENVTELFEMFADGRIDPLVSEVYALEDYEAAFAALTGRRARGKLVFDLTK